MSAPIITAHLEVAPIYICGHRELTESAMKDHIEGYGMARKGHGGKMEISATLIELRTEATNSANRP